MMEATTSRLALVGALSDLANDLTGVFADVTVAGITEPVGKILTRGLNGLSQSEVVFVVGDDNSPAAGTVVRNLLRLKCKVVIVDLAGHGRFPDVNTIGSRPGMADIFDAAGIDLALLIVEPVAPAPSGTAVPDGGAHPTPVGPGAAPAADAPDEWRPLSEFPPPWAAPSEPSPPAVPVDAAEPVASGPAPWAPPELAGDDDGGPPVGPVTATAARLELASPPWALEPDPAPAPPWALEPDPGPESVTGWDATAGAARSSTAVDVAPPWEIAAREGLRRRRHRRPAVENGAPVAAHGPAVVSASQVATVADGDTPPDPPWAASGPPAAPSPSPTTTVPDAAPGPPWDSSTVAVATLDVAPTPGRGAPGGGNGAVASLATQSGSAWSLPLKRSQWAAGEPGGTDEPAVVGDRPRFQNGTGPVGAVAAAGGVPPWMSAPGPAAASTQPTGGARVVRPAHDGPATAGLYTSTREAGSPGKVLAVVAGKGGVGKSTLTVWLAQAIGAALRSRSRTCGLIDANIGHGDVSKLLGLWGQSPDLSDIAHGRPVSDQELDRTLVGVDWLNARCLFGPRDAKAVSTDAGITALGSAVNLMRRRFSWTVIDCPVGQPHDVIYREFVLREADLMVVVAAPDEPTLADTAHFLEWCSAPVVDGGMAYPTDRAAIILNRADPGTGISYEQVSQRLGRYRLLGQIPETGHVRRDRNEGVADTPAVAASVIARVVTETTGVSVSVSPDRARSSGRRDDDRRPGVLSGLMSRLSR